MLEMTELERSRVDMAKSEETGEVLNDMLHAIRTPQTIVVAENQKTSEQPAPQSEIGAQADGYPASAQNDHQEQAGQSGDGSPAVADPAAQEQAENSAEGEIETPEVPVEGEAGGDESSAGDAPAGESSDAPAGESSESSDAPAGENSESSDAPAGESSESSDAPAGESSEEPAGASFTPVEESSARRLRIRDLEPGMELKGRVTSVALYGIFVDIGVGRDGLVHISEMSNTRINSPSDLVQIGDTVAIWVKSIDVDARRISLTMRSPSDRGERRTRRSEINREALANLKVGDVVEGTITGMAQFGAFVDIGVGKDGLVHISELSDGRVEKPEDAVEVNQQYTFKLLEVDPEGNRISLSLRRAQRSQKMQQLSPGQILDGRISGMAPFGAFVDIGVGRDGLVHISQLSENHVNKVEDEVKVGDAVQVRILEVDPQNKRISLSMRLEEPEPPAEEDVAATVPEQPIEPPPNSRFSMSAVASRESKRQRDGDRDKDRDRDRDRKRSQNAAQPVIETYSTEDDEEETFEGNATLEDLVSKFGKPNNRKDKDRRRRRDEREEEEETEDEEERAIRKRQRDAQRRTLQQLLEEEGG
jgi:predicted RNA-binding protein with RPS1 domain